jgi:disulfide bond formation protein DsbB
MTALRKPLLVSIGIGSLALLGAALYLQVVKSMLPCPLCVLQRYAFALVALCCFVGAIMRGKTERFMTGLGVLSALGGAAIAGWHLWIKAHPTVSCGIDPLETSLNTIPTARWLPTLFKADGLCTTDYPPIFGLSIPQWSLLWFLVFAFVMLATLARRKQLVSFG